MQPQASAGYSTLDDSLNHAWQQVSKKLQAHYGEAVFKSWLRALSFVGADNNKVKLSVPTRFMREWISSHYMQEITKFWQEQPVAEGFALEVVVQQNPATAAPAAQNAAAPNVITHASWQQPEAADANAYLGAPLDPRYTFENFVVGKPNELAHAAARRVAESAQVVPGCNPLFLYGGVGLGKTHLMLSLIHI